MKEIKEKPEANKKIRKGDKVKVVAGKDEGRIGTVLRVITKPKRAFS